MKKKSETSETVIYEYYPDFDENYTGLIQFNKLSRDLEILKPMDKYDANYSNRVWSKLRRIARSGQNYPDVTSWQG